MSDDERSGTGAGPSAAVVKPDVVSPEVLEPEVVGPEVVGTDDATAPAVPEFQEQVTRPTKLIRVASMVRSMLDEVRRAPLDDAGRARLAEIHDKSLQELEGVLSPDLKSELDGIALSFGPDSRPTESELRIAQAQLVGWLEGLFHGIQATLFTQQMAAQGQLEEMRRGQQPALEMPGRMPGAYL